MAKFIILICLLVASIYGYNDDPLTRTTSTVKPDERKNDIITFIDSDLIVAENGTDDVDPLSRAGFVDSLIEKADEHKNDIIKAIDSGVKFAKNRAHDSIRAITKLLEQLNEKAASVIDGATINVKNAVHKVINMIDGLSSKLPGVDITECLEMEREVNYTASRIVSRVSFCVKEKIDEGKYRVENIVTDTDKFLVDLDLIHHRAVRCSNDGNGTIDVIVCLKDALKETYKYTRERSPVLLKGIKRVTSSVMFAIPSLVGCTAANTVSQLFGSIDDTVSDIKVCMKEKMDAVTRPA